MSKISQETFDSIVAENVAEFEMSYDEAVEDAENQLKLQGADLSHIDRTPPELRKEKEMSHVMNRIMADIAATKDAKNLEGLVTAIKSMQKEIGQDEQGKAIFEKMGGLGVLFSLLGDQVFAAVAADVLSGLVTALRIPAFRDHISPANFELILSVIRDNVRLSKVCISGCNALKNSCIKNESNRVFLVENNVIDLMEVIVAEHLSKDVLMPLFGLVRGLILTDDEGRSGFTFKGPEHALKISSTTVMDVILRSLNGIEFDEDLVVDACNTLSKLAIRNDICDIIRNKGGIVHLLRLLTKESRKIETIKYSTIALKSLAGNDDCKREICENEGLYIMLQILQQFSATPDVLENVLSCLAAVILRNPDYSQKLAEIGAADVIVNLMQRHIKDSPGILKFACVTIRNAVSRNPENRPVFLTAGAEEILREVGKVHPALYQDYAKAALRDLGCHVELREEWKGEIGKGSRLMN